MNLLKLKLALPILFIITFNSYSQSETITNQEVISYKNLLRKHGRNTDSLSHYANKYLIYAKENKLPFSEYSAYVALGNAKRLIGNIKESNEYYYNALSIATYQLDSIAKYKVMDNIALNHKRSGRIDSAFYYFKKSNKYYSDDFQTLPASMAKMNIGLCYLQYMELDSALLYLNKSLLNFKSLNNDRFIAQNYHMLGELQFQKTNYGKTIAYIDSSLILCKKINFKPLLSTNYALKARAYTKINNIDSIKKYTELAESNRIRMRGSNTSSPNIAPLNESSRLQQARFNENLLDNSSKTKRFYQTNFFIAIIVLIVLGLLTLTFFKRNVRINKEVKLLQQSINLLKEKHQEKETQTENLIQLKSKASINCNNILFVKSDGHYVEYHLDIRKNPEIDRNSLTEVEKSLPLNSFVRIHKSYIVNINRIKIINSTKVMLDNGEWINLSRIYKQQLKDLLNKD